MDPAVFAIPGFHFGGDDACGSNGCWLQQEAHEAEAPNAQPHQRDEQKKMEKQNGCESLSARRSLPPVLRSTVSQSLQKESSRVVRNMRQPSFPTNSLRVTVTFTGDSDNDEKAIKVHQPWILRHSSPSMDSTGRDSTRNNEGRGKACQTNKPRLRMHNHFKK